MGIAPHLVFLRTIIHNPATPGAEAHHKVRLEIGTEPGRLCHFGAGLHGKNPHFPGRDGALRRPDAAARRPYLGRISFCTPGAAAWKQFRREIGTEPGRLRHFGEGSVVRRTCSFDSGRGGGAGRPRRNRKQVRIENGRHSRRRIHDGRQSRRGGCQAGPSRQGGWFFHGSNPGDAGSLSKSDGVKSIALEESQKSGRAGQLDGGGEVLQCPIEGGGADALLQYEHLGL